jgi:FAD/FMN-containing dehydrogenase
LYVISCALQCDWFVDVKWVDAQGEVHNSAKGSEEAFALCGGLGLLGTITELTLQLTQHSNTHFSTWYLKPDDNLADDVEAMLKVGGVSHYKSNNFELTAVPYGTRGSLSAATTTFSLL